MKIRSITFLCDPGWLLRASVMEIGARFIDAARPAFERAGYEVQTTHLASVPFPDLITEPDHGGLIELAQALESAAGQRGYNYVSLGPAFPDELDSFTAIPEGLAATEVAFFAGLMTTSDSGISLPAVRACAQIIHRAATISPDGFANLRFAALANVPPGSPFFPAAYHAGGGPAFALALEAADLAVMAFDGAESLNQARANLIQSTESHAMALGSVAHEAEDRTGVRFAGIDFSLAPFPEAALSMGTALERLGLPALGLHGSLAAAAFVADTMDKATFQRAGFNGLFLPVLEDAVLAQRAAEGALGIKDLLLYSAVCGTGLDTVPLPGDTTPEELTTLLMDVAFLAQRLDKPLTARLMPVPGKAAGDPTGFEFDYFANSRVMALESGPLFGAFSGESTVCLRPRAGGS